MEFNLSLSGEHLNTSHRGENKLPDQVTVYLASIAQYLWLGHEQWVIDDTLERSVLEVIMWESICLVIKQVFGKFCTPERRQKVDEQSDYNFCCPLEYCIIYKEF